MTVVVPNATRVLIVESVPELANVWQRHLERHCMVVAHAYGQQDAIAHLSEHETDIIIQDLVINEGAALAIADYANYRQPAARVIFVTNTTFFSDGSILPIPQMPVRLSKAVRCQRIWRRWLRITVQKSARPSCAREGCSNLSAD